MRSRVVRSRGVVPDYSQLEKIFRMLGPNETIKIVTHSFGGAYARGMVDALRKYMLEVLKMTPEEVNNKLEWQLDRATFNSSRLLLLMLMFEIRSKQLVIRIE